MTTILDPISWSNDADAEYGRAQNQSLTETLIERCLVGDVQAYNLLYQRHAGYMYRVVYNLLRQKEDAEEVLQDSFEQASRHQEFQALSLPHL